METAPGGDPVADRHRALASGTRIRLLELLRPAGDRDAGWLAGELHLHVNTVRAHLAILERAGFVRSTTEDRRVRGRPRVLYRAVPDHTDDDAYRMLASVLAGTLAADLPDARAAAERAGERWGRDLIGSTDQTGPPDAVTTADRAVEVLDRLGFAPDRDPAVPGHIVLRRCPFLDVASEHEEVVCGLHLGILRGALAAAGHPTEQVSLRPFVSVDRCEVSVAS